MALSNNKITAPVSVDDVADCLGMSRSSTLAALCTYEGINMWAKISLRAMEHHSHLIGINRAMVTLELHFQI